MRLFFCVELEEEVRQALAEVAKRCRGGLGNGSWVSPENYHLTVRFLGEVPEERVKELLDVGEETARATAPFSLVLAVLGGFPQPKAARVLWVGPRKESVEFQGLCRRLETAVQALGFPPEKREALPHVTLARFKAPKDLRSLVHMEVAIPEAQVRSLTLMRSELRPEGAKYTPLARWEFGG